MSTKPYPWPPKQARPDVSKPGRSTASGLLAAPVYRRTAACPYGNHLGRPWLLLVTKSGSILCARMHSL